MSVTFFKLRLSTLTLTMHTADYKEMHIGNGICLIMLSTMRKEKCSPEKNCHLCFANERNVRSFKEAGNKLPIRFTLNFQIKPVA